MVSFLPASRKDFRLLTGTSFRTALFSPPFSVQNSRILAISLGIRYTEDIRFNILRISFSLFFAVGRPQFLQGKGVFYFPFRLIFRMQKRLTRSPVSALPLILIDFVLLFFLMRSQVNLFFSLVKTARSVFFPKGLFSFSCPPLSAGWGSRL